PRLAGFSLKCFCWLLEMRMTNALILAYMRKANLITEIFQKTQYSEPPMYSPQYLEKQVEEKMVEVLPTGSTAPQRVAVAVRCLPPYVPKPSINGGNHDHIDAQKFQYATVRDYAHAYSSGRFTPTQVAERFLAAVEETQKMSPALNLFIPLDAQNVLSQAAASTERYREGGQLSVLDGILIAVKDEIDCLPYPTTGGCTWLDKTRQVTEDAAVVKRLRECGAIMVGNTNMHELGAGTTGINPHYGTTRNPHDRTRISGGSSGGSAATVAAGLCPIALGVDGGGSVRMPASLCGIVGLKPTFGRITKSGLLPLNWTIGMLGTLTGSVEDAYIIYAAKQGHLPSDKLLSFPPPATLPLLNDSQTESTNMAKLIGDVKFAKFPKWFNDTDDPVGRICDKALQLVQGTYGCKVVDVSIPELQAMRLAHYITIGSECSAALGVQYENVGQKVSGGDVRSTITIFQCFNNREYVTAPRIRSRCMQHHMDIFEKADFIVTPTTACTASPVREVAEKYGELDYQNGGLPAISIPVGYDDKGLPIGLQLIGRPWSEATLLRMAIAFEKICAPQLQPEVYFDLLK
uniref:Amidase domain-containing protein n=1 Tax=Physcomitrium patens TaxID=3218 RepID=A0A7I4AGV9_PHYPA